jgi:hypothetical protein
MGLSRPLMIIARQRAAVRTSRECKIVHPAVLHHAIQRGEMWEQYVAFCLAVVWHMPLNLLALCPRLCI